MTKVSRLLWAVAPTALIAVALAGGAPDTSAPELQPRQSTPVVVAEATDEPDQTPTLSPAEFALTAEAVALANAGCLQCHTDEDQLRTLAVEEEVVSLSEGPG